MSDIHYPPGLPGTKTKKSAVDRNVFSGPPKLVPGGAILDGSESRDPLNTDDVDILRSGVVLGKQTSSGLYAPSIIGTLAEAYNESASSTSDNLEMVVSAATATEIVRRIGTSGTFKVTGPPSDAGTVATETITFSAVNTTTGVVTITDADNDFIAGSFVQPTDGSEDPLGVLYAQGGVKVTDDSDDDIDVFITLAIGGVVVDGGLINEPSDASLKTWLHSKLNGGDGTTDLRGAFHFLDTYAAS